MSFFSAALFVYLKFPPLLTEVSICFETLQSRSRKRVSVDVGADPAFAKEAFLECWVFCLSDAKLFSKCRHCYAS
jgi:hypothetical protein